MSAAKESVPHDPNAMDTAVDMINHSERAVKQESVQQELNPQDPDVMDTAINMMNTAVDMMNAAVDMANNSERAVQQDPNPQVPDAMEVAVDAANRSQRAVSSDSTLSMLSRTPSPPSFVAELNKKSQDQENSDPPTTNPG
jgi:hypothetical protein